MPTSKLVSLPGYRVPERDIPRERQRTRRRRIRTINVMRGQISNDPSGTKAR
jgi:hypothetical protein